jgi:hypothetical protein
MGGLDEPKAATEPEAAKSVTEVVPLMREYFVLKDQMSRLREARHGFMETYSCLSPRSDDPMEPPTPCVYRAYGESELEGDACEPCKRRHWFYTERKKNAQRRGVIMRTVRHRVAPPS